MEEHVEPLDDGESLADRIGSIIRAAQKGKSASTVLKNLLKAEDLLLNKEHDLLDNFLDEMLEFMDSAHTSVKCFVTSFIQNACKKDPEVIKKAIATLAYLLSGGSSANVRVTKRVIIVVANIYPFILKWAVGRRNDPDTEKCWTAFCLLKGRIMQTIDSDNEGIRTMTFKFLESVILAQSPKTADSENGRGDIMGISDIPRDHRFISFRQMQSEASHNLQALIDQTALSHISSMNLTACLNVLCTIARQRPDYINKVVDAFEVLHVNLPPTLGTIQVKSVRKELKVHLLRMLRLAPAVPFHSRIITLLTDLGATNGEMQRAIPANLADLKRKAKRGSEASETVEKKRRVDNALLDDDYADESEKVTEPVVESARQTAIDITAEYVFQRLTPTVVSNLVIISLMTMPDQIPPAFASSFTPIAAAGTEAQIRHLSRMIATQATQDGQGPGVDHMKEEKRQRQIDRTNARAEGALIPPTPMLHMGDHAGTSKASKKLPPVIPKGGLAGPTPKAKVQFDLIQSAANKPMPPEEAMELFQIAFTRIMNTERRAKQGGAALLHNSILVRLATRYDLDHVIYDKLMIDFIIEDHKARTELALLWITELYAQYQGFSICVPKASKHAKRSQTELLKRYDTVMCGLLNTFYQHGLHREAIFHKMLLDAPLVTDNALKLLKTACLDETFGAFGMTTVRELILTRNRQRHEMLNLLFELTFFENPQNLRASCVEIVKELCELSYLKNDVRQHLIKQMESFILPVPPKKFAPEATELVWTESIYRNCLHLYLAVLPFDPSLLLPLAETYAKASNELKKVFQHSIDSAIRTIGVHNKEVLRLVEECPVGAEPLLVRVVNLLTERDPVTKELVVRLKKLQKDRDADVRTMIPVLTGLDKADIIRILPQFVLKRINQKTVLSVFKKLLNGRHIETGEPVMTGIDLAYEYHLIEPSTSSETETQIGNLQYLLDALSSRETIANAVEAILDLRPLPNLVYSTLAAVYKKCPTLDGFLSNVLQKLISKELWKETDESKEAFFNSLSLLKSVAFTAILTCFSTEEFMEYIEFREKRGTKEEALKALKDHLPSLSTHQQKSIGSAVMDFIRDKDDKHDENSGEKDKDRARELDKEKRREKEKEREKKRESRRESRRSKD